MNHQNEDTNNYREPMEFNLKNAELEDSLFIQYIIDPGIL